MMTGSRHFKRNPKPAEALSKLANTGVYVFEPEIFKYIPADTVYDFGKQLFPKVSRNGMRHFMVIK